MRSGTYYARNRERRLAYQRTYYAAHHEEWQLRDRAYYAVNRDRILIRQRAYDRTHQKDWRFTHRTEWLAHKAKYRDKHREEIRAYSAARYVANRAKFKAQNAAWFKNNPVKNRLRAARRKAQKMNVGGTYTVKEWLEKCALLGNVCFYCARSGRLQIEHLTPLSRGGTNDIANIVPACKSCNCRKWRRTAEEFLDLTRPGGLSFGVAS